MEKTKKTTEKEGVEGQIVCQQCNSRKIYITYLRNVEEATVLTLLCDSCGYLFPLHLNANVLMDKQSTIIITKSPPPYV